MTRDEYLAMLATEPATSKQVGAILAEFDRLGVADRTERLAITAALLDLEDLGSTTDLVMGDAGRLVAMLRSIQDRGELPDLAAPADDGQADEHNNDKHHGGDDSGNEHMTWPEAILRILIMIYAASQGKALPESFHPHVADFAR